MELLTNLIAYSDPTLYFSKLCTCKFDKSHHRASNLTEFHPKAPFTRYRITYISDPFSCQIRLLFTRLCMNPIISAPLVEIVIPGSSLYQRFVTHGFNRT